MKDINIDKISSIEHVFIEALIEIGDRWKRGKELSIKSLPKLDNKLWGLKKQRLVLVGGRPSQGKSTLMLQMAMDFVEEGKTVLFFSLEMTNVMCAERLLCNKGGIDNMTIFTGEATKNPNNTEIINNVNNLMKGKNLIFIESYGRTFPEILQIVEGFNKPIDAVFIDYIQMIRASNKSKKEAIDEYIKQLREYAIDKKFCAIIGSQINRGAHEGKEIRKPYLWELKGSGELEEHTDVCLLVHWEFFYTSDITQKNNYSIVIAKNREGRTGSYDCEFYPEYYRIREIESDPKKVEDSRAGRDD